MSAIEKIKSLPALPSNGSSFYHYLHQVNQFPSLSQEEELGLARSYLEENNLDSARKLVTSHLKLVAKIALSYRSYGLPLADLVSEGNIGLIHAVKKYQPSLGFRLSTYAMWWIKAAIQEYILKSWSLVKLGTTASQKKLFFGLNKIKKKISALYGRSAGQQDYEEIAQTLGVTKQEVSEMDNRMQGSDISLNQPSSNLNDRRELVDLVPEPRLNQEQLIAHRQDWELKRRLLFQAVGMLNDREREILTARRLSEPHKTLEELSQTFAISKERVRQLENQAFNKVQTTVLTELMKTQGKQPMLTGLKLDSSNIRLLQG